MSATYLSHWADIEPLLDQALALPAPQRAAFLDTLPPALQRWRGLLAELLRHEAQAAEAGFLSLAASLPEFLQTGSTAPQSAGPALQAGQTLGPWLLLEPLGSGGMASVWLARQQSGDFQREVALKLPHSPSPLWAERFRRERDILARLNHPGIAKLFDAGVSESGLPWLAMERVQGLDILSWCEQRQASVAERLALLLQMADALQYAHSQLVVHRDIKPANVLVQDDGQLRLLDFGIAKLIAADEGAQVDAALTQIGQRPMTPEYASPEQVRGEEPGIASDVYALGVLAYRLLCAASPYTGARADSRHALERAVLDWQPPAPSSVVQSPVLRKALRGDLDTIVLKALAKSAAERYATIDALATDLRRHLAGLPVLARAPSWRYVVGRFVGRHRIAVCATAAAVIALLGTTGWALRSSQQARDETRRAEALYGFVLGLFNPDQDRAANLKQPDLPLKTIIERGARRALGELKDQPEARAKLLSDLSPMVEQMGLVELATTLAQTRLDEARRDHGSDSMAYAQALVARTHVREATGEFKQGYEEARQALAIYQAHQVKDPYRLAPLHEKLGGFGFRIHSTPDPDDAHHLEQAVALSAPLKDVNASQSSLLLALLRLYLGDVPKAYAAVQQGLQANQRDYGAESWQAATLEAVLGVMADHWQRPADADPLLRHSVSAMRQSMGPDYIGLARNEIGLAGLLFAGQGREEARQLMADALRIVALPANAGYGGVKDQVQVLSLGLSWRGGDWAAVKAGCERYQQQGFKATTPYYTTHLSQVCAASALRAGDLTLAGRWLDAGQPGYTYFAAAPSWTIGLDLRRGELALAQGRSDEALRLWRHALAVSNTTQLAWQVRAWHLIARHGQMDAAEQGRLQAFTQSVERAGGERYYAEYLDLLREAGRAAQAR
ncbi:MAG: serine/threonine-protein kinase [Alicycliphilus sp.]